jgi:hypothetical protein
MDEPTNDLDLDTLRVLESGHQEYPAQRSWSATTAYFLNRVARTSSRSKGEVSKGEGPEIHFFPGEYEDYHEWREAGPASARHRPGLARPASTASSALPRLSACDPAAAPDRRRALCSPSEVAMARATLEGYAPGAPSRPRRARACWPSSTSIPYDAHLREPAGSAT